MKWQKEIYLVAFYDKLSTTAGLFLLTPGPARGLNEYDKLPYLIQYLADCDSFLFFI